MNDELEELLKSCLDDDYEEKSLPYRQTMTYYRCALREVETKFRVLDEQFSMYYDRNPIENIETRIKSQTSIMKKLKNRGLPLTLESMQDNLFDIAGIRVIGSFVDDIYMLAKLLLQQDDVHLIERKDYIAHPKPNGYRSLHLIIETPIFLANEYNFVPSQWIYGLHWNISCVIRKIFHLNDWRKWQLIFMKPLKFVHD